MLSRPRRNRKSAAMRTLCAETTLSSKNFIMPFFALKGENRERIRPSLPPLSAFSKEGIARQMEYLHKKGVPGVLLFAAESAKDPLGTEALSEKGAVPQVVRFLKKEIPSLVICCDVALDPYTSHGHDGVIDAQGNVCNDETVKILVEMSCLLASCGADVIAPSDMMDGRVRAIRQGLDAKGFSAVSILSYAAKYASSLYTPFRQTLESSVSIGDKKGYQMNPANSREAIREALLDEQEGADMLLVKPALPYLDIVAKLRELTTLPLCAYHVSGEYAMVKAAHAQGYGEEIPIFLESLLSMRRAGADILISYALPEVVESLVT